MNERMRYSVVIKFDSIHKLAMNWEGYPCQSLLCCYTLWLIKYNRHLF